MLTSSEVARLFSVSRITVANWIRAGKFPAIQTPGGNFRISRGDLLAYYAKSGIPAPAELLTPEGAPGILIVDDERIVASMLERLMKKEYPGAWVKTADSGVAAMIEVGRRRPDMLILDMRMPEMDGAAVIRRLKEDPALRGICVVAVSGHPAEEARALAAGADQFALKPDRLLELIKEFSAWCPALLPARHPL
jgi:excisionase family DNA binding protein